MSHGTEPADDAFISVFTPSQTKAEYLEAIFVQRHALLEDTVERIHESAATSNKHHLLFVGPRGSGKTHLVTLLVHRLGQRPDITKKLRIAWLNEDETSTTMLDLLLRIYQALVKRYPNVYNAASLETAFELEADEAQRFLTKLLLESISQEHATILVVVENLDALFEGLGDIGQKQLRALIQENPRFAIVATAQHLSDYFRSRNHPFFGFFQTAHFKPLTEAEAAELLGKISLLKERPEVARFLRTRKGRARVRALHHLSGGNHRVYIVLSQFVTQDSIDALVTPFIKMVDELTPYYQERLRWLPPQQRKIIAFLSTSTRPVSVKNIAKRLFATPQTISSQLKDLRNKGYVISTQRGRESLYEITEPLMRICVEVKENKSSEPLALLVDFIRAWYDQSDLTQRLANKEISATARPYLLAALEKSATQELNTVQTFEKGQAQPTQVFDHSKSDELKKAIEEYTAIVESKDATADEVAPALFNLGVAYVRSGKITKAIANFSAVTDLEGAPAEWIAAALYNRGVAYREKGEMEKEIADYSAVIDFNGVSTEMIALALTNRGVAYSQRGEVARGIADYSAVVELEDAPTEEIAAALYNRGVTYTYEGEPEKAISDFTTIVGLSDVPTEQVVLARMYSAEIHVFAGRWAEAVQSAQEGLKLSVSTTPPQTHNATYLIGAIFSASLDPALRKQRITEFARLYIEHESLTAILGAGLVKHLGSLYQTDAALPSPDNLDLWLSAWEEASQGVDKLQVPMRIFRTGVAFLKTGGEDQSILLDLTENERSILQQAFGMVDA